jgi:hypothetical protein
MAIWNAVGIQGALLSHLLGDPIYLSTITIGRKFSKVHAGTFNYVLGPPEHTINCLSHLKFSLML